MLFKKGHREDAIRMITSAINHAKQAGPLYTKRGGYYLREERYKLALSDSDMAMVLDPTQKQGWIYRMKADCCVNLGKYEEAISELKRAIALEPHDEYFKFLGEVYYQQKRFDDAIASFSKGIAKNPKNYWLYRLRGDVYFQQKRYQKAVDDYSAVIRIVPNDTTGYGARAKAYERMGLHALADKDFARTKKGHDEMSDLLK